MSKVIIIGGGWSGCAAAITAKNAGADVVLIEKTDMLLGLGNVGGIMRNNGRYTATEESIALGMDELFKITDQLSRHVNIDFPGHEHTSLYDVSLVEPAVRRLLEEKKIDIYLQDRVTDVKMKGNHITGIVLANEEIIEGDVFIETTGSTGPMGNCLKYGNGCAMCILRCPSFGPRISISQRAGVEDLLGERDNSYGAFSGSCKLNKDSISEEIREQLNSTGVAILPIPKEDISEEKLGLKVCQQYALKEFAENVILLDTGHAKLMSPYYPLDKLRKIKGLENARYEDPYSGGKGNSIRYLSMAPRNNTLKVEGIENLFCGGEKSGLFVGHTEAIVTGSLAGHNAVRQSLGMPLLELPTNIACGDIIHYANNQISTIEGRKKRFTFAGSIYFDRMKDKGLYLLDKEEIQRKINKMNLENIYKERLI